MSHYTLPLRTMHALAMVGAMLLMPAARSYGQHGSTNDAIYPYSKVPFVIGNVELRVEHERWVARDRSDHHEIASAPTAMYLEVASPIYLYERDGGRYAVWSGCYPHNCSDEYGALVYDAEANRFYRFHAIENADGDSVYVDGNYQPQDNKRYVQLFGSPPKAIRDTLLRSGDREVTGELCSSDYCDGPVSGPELSPQAKRMLEAQQAAANAILEPLGLHIETPYRTVRKRLLALGWRSSIPHESYKLYHVSKEFHELVSDGGNSGVYSASWKKGSQQLILAIEENQNEPIVVDVSKP